MRTKHLTAATGLSESGIVAGSTAAAMESKLGLRSIGDLLRYYPKRHEDRTAFRPIASIRYGETACIAGTVVSVESAPTRRLSVVKVGIRDAGGMAHLTFFNQWFLRKQFERLIGQNLVAYGRAGRGSPPAAIELSDAEWERVDAGDRAALSASRIVPVYALASGIGQGRMRKAVWDALEACASCAPERLPAKIQERCALMDSETALRQIHFPDSASLLDDARRRLAFDELFGVQLALAVRRRDVRAAPGIAFSGCSEAFRQLRGALPFCLTAAQERAVHRIGRDMVQPVPMSRLLQGDVGSGKTVVAMAALLTAVRGGCQAAIMAPTEILAAQHYAGIKAAFAALDIPVALLTGSLSSGAKADLLQCIADGHYPVVVGTHALIEADVRFARLGLAIVDEQHRFGVAQRAALRAKSRPGEACDLLVMTATPIPRTLTLTVYGDLDVSIIDELPPGRRPVRTHWKRTAERGDLYGALRGLIATGRQAYVICPLVEESEKLQAKAAANLAEHLAKDVYPEYRIGLLHGQMRSSDKDEAMRAFRAGETHIMVSTTVVEVGVDVPNASVIVIEDADRFGLAQLHQLRGRVGRGTAQSYCLLVADARAPGSAARLEAMVRTCDGFEIAEEDLRLRGPGEIFGTKQSGNLAAVLYDVMSDTALLTTARSEAFELLSSDPHLTSPENDGVRDLCSRAVQQLAAAPESG